MTAVITGIFNVGHKRKSVSHSFNPFRESRSARPVHDPSHMCTTDSSMEGFGEMSGSEII